MNASVFKNQLKKACFRFYLIALIFISQISLSKSQTIGIFYDQKVPQHEFAANDIRMALNEKGVTTEILDISVLTEKYKNPKVVIALKSDEKVKSLPGLNIGNLSELGEQAYLLQTTKTPELSFWVVGGDNNGAMYGALQLAENIQSDGLDGNYKVSESPYVLKRGIKYNLPLGKNAPTYYASNGGTSHQLAIEHVWDNSFWKEYFDEMARNRYNVISFWSPHPFTSMLDMEDEYPGIAIQDVEGYNGYFKKISITEKIKFWQEVMAYAKNRGFDIHFCTWNIFLWNANGKYGLTEEHEADQSATTEYLKKCTYKFLETYPNLDGLGVTAGENLGFDDNSKKIDWTWAAYGEGFNEFARAHPDRKLTFFHRQHQGDISDIIEKFNPLQEAENVTLDASFKYAKAHVHSTVKPDYWSWKFLEQIEENNMKTWLELRNDDFYFLHWGDHQFVRDFVTQMPEDKLLAGTFYGSDGWVFTREFTSKNPYYKNKQALEIQKHWYLYKLWGRLQYNPETPVEWFKNEMHIKYPEVKVNDLFEAWTKASNAMQLANEQVGGRGMPNQENVSRMLDFQWWPELYTRHDGFIPVEKTQYAGPMDGSKMCSLYETADGKCGDKISAFTTADKIEKLANEALKIIESFNTENTELNLNIADLKAMSFLSLYNANKNRAAIFFRQGNKQEALEKISAAYCYWKKYTNLMDTLYIPVDTQRNWDFGDSDWHDMDDEALKDYLNLGGVGIPSCPEN